MARSIDDFIQVTEGPKAVARACRLCKFFHTRRKVSGSGRGSGMREGNKQRGILIQHIKAEHPAAYAEAMEFHRGRAARLKERRNSRPITIP